MKKGNLKILIFYIVLFLGVVITLSFMFGNSGKEVLTYSDVLDYFKDDMVKEFVVDEDYYLTLKVYVANEDGTLSIDEKGNIKNSTKTVGYQLQSLGLFVEDFGRYYSGEEPNQNLLNFDIKPQKNVPFWISLLPYAIVIIVVVLLYVFMMKQATGGANKINSFGKAKVKTPQGDKNKIFDLDGFCYC